MKLKQIIVNYKRKLLIIDSCKNITISITIISTKNRIKRVVRAYQAIILLSYSTIIISIYFRDSIELLVERNLIFILLHNIKRFKSKSNILSYIINANIYVIQVNNIFEYIVIIARNLRLNIMQDYKKKRYYVVSSKYSYLIVRS